MAASAEDPIRLRVRVGPRSPLHPLLAALPPDAQASALLRWAEAGARQGAAGDGGPMAPGDDTPGAGMMTADGGEMAGMAAPTAGAGLVAALARVAAALERLADDGAAGRPHVAAVPVHDGDVRAAKLDGAWDG